MPPLSSASVSKGRGSVRNIVFQLDLVMAQPYIDHIKKSVMSYQKVMSTPPLPPHSTHILFPLITNPHLKQQGAMCGCSP